MLTCLGLLPHTNAALNTSSSISQLQLHLKMAMHYVDGASALLCNESVALMVFEPNIIPLMSIPLGLGNRGSRFPNFDISSPELSWLWDLNLEIA